MDTNQITGVVTNIQRCSTEDGPGIRTTVFLKGCPLSCVWCHNIEAIASEPQVVWYQSKCIGERDCIDACPENVLELTEGGMHIDRSKCKKCGSCEDACPTSAIRLMGKTWIVAELVEELLKDKIFFDTSNGGVTISGGEPTLQIEFLIAIANGLRDHGVHVALDTCGYCNADTMQEALSSVDMVLYDLKQMNDEKHILFTGVPLERILENAKIVGSTELPVWIRTPVIPNHTDSERNIRAIAEFAKEHIPNAVRYDLLAFNKMCIEKYSLFGREYPLKDEQLVEVEKMERLSDIAREIGTMKVVWSGMTRRKESTLQTEVEEKVKHCE